MQYQRQETTVRLFAFPEVDNLILSELWTRMILFYVFKDCLCWQHAVRIDLIGCLIFPSC